MAASVGELIDALEVAYTQYATARRKSANAKADYEGVYRTALVKSTEKSASGKTIVADALALEQKQSLIRAEAMEDITSTHIRVLLGQLVAAQSLQKYAGKIDGGTDW